MSLSSSAVSIEGSEIADPSIPFRSWLVCFSAALFFFYEFVQMNMFNAINHYLMASFHVGAEQLGWMSSGYFFANVLFMFPAGLLLDRLSVRKLILAAMTLCVFGTVLFSLTTSYSVALLARFLTGIGGSFPFLCCLRLASRWFSLRKLALVSGLMVTMAMMGGMAVQTPLTLLTTAVGWREALRLDAVLGIVFIGVIWCYVHDFPDNYDRSQEASSVMSVRSVLHSIRSSIMNLSNWLYGLYTSLLNLPVVLLGGVWGSLYLTQARGFSTTDASYATMMIFLGTIVGSPVVGWLSDRIEKRRMPMTVGALASIAVAFAIITPAQLTVSEAIVLFFAFGFTTSSQILSYPAIAAANSKAHAGSALGFASVIIMFGGFFFEPFFGWLLERHWHGIKVAGVAVYSAHAYWSAMLLFPVVFVVGLFAVGFAKESRAHASSIEKP